MVSTDRTFCSSFGIIAVINIDFTHIANITKSPGTNGDGSSDVLAVLIHFFLFVVPSIVRAKTDDGD